ncbi:ricin-type beta-trefoil lectin domain protein [Kitasatospora indigofera]|uniref:ricin-type beta-trefoil lectin domain protein n=1 Tax=Kitasatospora indigofera TaxID=67307 RepID=UPI00369F2F94
MIKSNGAHRALPILLSATLLLAGAALSAPPASANDGVFQAAANYAASATPNGAIAAVPPMGYNNWARSQCYAQAPLDGSNALGYSFQQYMMDNAKGLSDAGLIAAGYKTVTVDDCWMYRDSTGKLRGALNWGGATDVRNPAKQPGFDADLTTYGDYLHSLGAKFGIYNTRGTKTCSIAAETAPNQPNGSWGHEQIDADSYVAWGVEAFKYDNCGTVGLTFDAKTLTAKMANALKTAVAKANAAGKPAPNVLFNISTPAGMGNSSVKFAEMNWVRDLGQQWRIGPDIYNYKAATDPWDQKISGYNWGVYQTVDFSLELSRYQGPGNWNDPDMLLIGDNGMTTAEERSQMSLFSAMAAPLVISTDARKFSPAYIAAHPAEAAHLNASVEILKNPEVIAVDQDPLGAGGYRVSGGGRNSTTGVSTSDSGVDVVVKPLADGGRAVVVLNKGSASTTQTLDLKSLGFNAAGCTYDVRDLWAHTSSALTGTVALTIAPHDSAMLRVTAQNGCGSTTARGQITASRNTWDGASLCLDNFHSRTGATSAVILYQCTSAANQQWQMNTDGSIKLLQADAGDFCLTAQSGTSTSAVNAASGQWVGVAPCGSAPERQTWTYNRDGNLKLAGTTKCLDVYKGTTTTPGTPVGLYACGAAPNNIYVHQTWAAPYSTPPGS